MKRRDYNKIRKLSKQCFSVPELAIMYQTSEYMIRKVLDDMI